tara:strand:- start:1268 stop:1807 length:540 start_codon:yes stop_codon:yes gene_type:complete
MSKNHKKQESEHKKNDPLEMGAVSLDRKQRLDISVYQRDPKYKGKAFVIINEEDIDKYLEVGYVPVKRQSRSTEIFDGINSQEKVGIDQWQTWVVSMFGGGTTRAYLLVIDEEEHQRIKIDPINKRNEEIRTAMGMGVVDDEAKKDSKDMVTYQANNPTGGKGFEQLGGQQGFNQLTST